MDEESVFEGMRKWRRQLHARPEFGFEEHETAAFVAEKLRNFGISDVVERVGGTGVVATLTCGKGTRSVALRADMDALRISEKGEHAHRSSNDGVMHACGHDGHTAMLLGAARMLASEGSFNGTVRLIFQPAEEWGSGALAMLDDGLLERFPFEEIYGLHNWPGVAVGSFQTAPGPVMSAEDNFEIKIEGIGGHSSRPDNVREVMVAACSTVLALQTIISRRIPPAEVGVVSVTEIITDGARNVLPGEARIKGDVRSFKPEISELVEREILSIVHGSAVTFGCHASLDYSRQFVPLVNDPRLTSEAVLAARSVFGNDNVVSNRSPITASEDFARFLQRVPGCFGFIGNGVDSPPLHNPGYDFNDAMLLNGARWFKTVVERRLPII